MNKHEVKKCPRCENVFECKPGNIMQCQCCTVKLSGEQLAYIEQRYNDCLCLDCLQWLSDELNLFKDKLAIRM